MKEPPGQNTQAGTAAPWENRLAIAFVEIGTTVTRTRAVDGCDWTFTEPKPDGWSNIWFEIHASTHAGDTGHDVTIASARTATVNNEPGPEDE